MKYKVLNSIKNFPHKFPFLFCANISFIIFFIELTIFNKARISKPNNIFTCLIPFILLFTFLMTVILLLLHVIKSLNFRRKDIIPFIITIMILLLINYFCLLNTSYDLVTILGSIISIILVEVIKQNKSNAIKSRCDYYYNQFKKKYKGKKQLEKIKFNEMYFENKTNTYSRLLETFLLMLMLTILFSFEIINFSVFEEYINLKTNDGVIYLTNTTSELSFKKLELLIVIEMYSLFAASIIFLMISYFASKRIDTIYTERKKPISERYNESFFDADFINLFNNTISEDLREYFGEYTENEIIILEGRKTYRITKEIEKGIKYPFEIVKII